MKVLTTVPASSDMDLRTIPRLLKNGLMIVGIATLLFVVFSFGWNGEPPTVELE